MSIFYKNKLFDEYFLHKSMDAAERILQFIDFKGFNEGKKGKSLRHFYNLIETSTGAIRPDRSVGSEILMKIFDKFPDLNMDWVVTGRGKMILEEDKKDGGTHKDLLIKTLQKSLADKEKLIEMLEVQLKEKTQESSRRKTSSL